MFKLLPFIVLVLLTAKANAGPELASRNWLPPPPGDEDASTLNNTATTTAAPEAESINQTDDSKDLSDQHEEQHQSISGPPIVANSLYRFHHHLFPAETIDLPLHFSTRAGLRTVIAPETITVHEPAVAKIGEVVQRIPTAVSHQSQTIVHKHARVSTPIVVPAIRSVSAHVVRAYHTPLILTPHQLQIPELQ